MEALWPGQSCTIVMDNRAVSPAARHATPDRGWDRAEDEAVMREQGMTATSVPVQGVPKRAARWAKQTNREASAAPETLNVELEGEAAVKGGAKASGTLKSTAQDWQVPDSPEVKSAFIGLHESRSGPRRAPGVQDGEDDQEGAAQTAAHPAVHGPGAWCAPPSPPPRESPPRRHFCLGGMPAPH